MKFRIAALALALFSTCGIAAECKAPDTYKVGNVDLIDMSVNDAMSKLLANVPYSVEVIGGDDVRITAKGITADLKTVLDRLAKDVNFSWTIKECVLSVAVAAPPEPVKVWVASPSDKWISDTFKRWAGNEWTVIWSAPKDFSVSAAVQYEGTFVQAVTQAIESLSMTDSPVEAKFYPNKVVRITRFTGQASDLKR